MNSSEKRDPLNRPEDFQERWEDFVAFFNTVRAHNPVVTGDFEKQVNDVFFELINTKDIEKKELTLQHGIQILKRACSIPNYTPLTARDVGFVMFCFVAFGAIWAAPRIKAPVEDLDPDLIQ